MYYLKFTFEGPEYTRYLVFFYDSLADFLKYWKTEWLFFLKLNNFRKLR